MYLVLTMLVVPNRTTSRTWWEVRGVLEGYGAGHVSSK
jgi:hypothetical protein